ncbi:MAG: D-tagatose-bisphosphate aldolase, class II, non-catalytic subunit [Proteobacteria bacterium]|nr:D-tagatose-bisphosphate aldolase, class II, non-catalytic subunit [Pseudomonadota bacterium]
MNAMLDLVRRHKSGGRVGIYSVCSAHPLVLEAALRLARQTGSLALVEATSNQVNQDGGYTGMLPADFRQRVLAIAGAVGLPHERVVLGGDHLGPNCWQSLPAATALLNAGVMVDQYVAAGFRKIHLDCSMSCADDPPTLGDEVIADRAAALCKITEGQWRKAGGEPPVYIIGTEVPVPGGAHEDLEGLAVTTPEAARTTIEVHRKAFERHGVQDAWSRVIGLVTQPGVEFDHHKVIDYVPAKAVSLSRSIEPVGGMVFEAHSTDYQTPAALADLVRDHFAILKVGPGVTFALREVLWALADIADELHVAPSLKQIVLAEMNRNPRYWRAYYTNPAQQEFDLQYSLSDRIRYYWSTPVVEAACSQLLKELAARGIPLTLISQYLPVQYAAIRAGRLANDPRELVLDGVEQVLRHYDRACRPEAAGRAAID